MDSHRLQSQQAHQQLREVPRASCQTKPNRSKLERIGGLVQAQNRSLALMALPNVP